MPSYNPNIFDPTNRFPVFQNVALTKSDLIRLRDERKKAQDFYPNNWDNRAIDNQQLFQIGNKLYPSNVVPSFQRDLQFHHGQEAKASNSIPSDKDNEIAKILNDNLQDYFNHSSLHGLNHVGDASLTMAERLFWLLSFICAVGFAAYFINSLYVKFDVNPTLMTMNPDQTSIETLPFPAITVCNMNQAKRNEAEKILRNGSVIDKELLNDFCGLNNIPTPDSAKDGVAKWSNVHRFILKVSQSCQDMIKVCLYKEQKLDCNFVFNTELTDEGLCCTFNGLPKQNIFRNPQEMNGLNLTYPPDVIEWNPEDGYPPKSSSNGIPLKAAGSGVDFGLSVVIDADIDSYYCSSSSSMGFKVQLHNPIETPKMADFGFLLPPGKETRVEVTPRIVDASESLISLDVEKRKCFYVRERRLRFFKYYTQRNCNLECQANYTLELCHCVPYYLPKDKDGNICGKKDDWCVNSAKSITDGPVDNNQMCNCLPGCFELNFQTSLTYGEFSTNMVMKSNIVGNLSKDYFVKNIALVHFYFVNTQFTRNTKSELYGFSEFLSNTGGLLGLFLGFSFLSAVEVVYYATVRLCCFAFQHRQKKKPRSIRNAINVNRNSASVYPFVR